MSRTRTLDCPQCARTMSQRKERGVMIDYCPECGGVWLDPGELEEIVDDPRRHRHSHTHRSHGGDETESGGDDGGGEGGLFGAVVDAISADGDGGDGGGGFGGDGGGGGGGE